MLERGNEQHLFQK